MSEAPDVCRCMMSSSPYPDPEPDGSCPLCGKRSRRTVTADQRHAVVELCESGHYYGKLVVNGEMQHTGCPICLREGLKAAREERETYRRAWMRSDEALESLRGRLTESAIP